MKRTITINTVCFLFIFCQLGFSQNPPAEGFNLEQSDPEAIKIADEVMEAMGGRKAWDRTRFLTWNFFGRRDHVWDRYTGDIRVESPNDELVILMNIQTGKGKVKKNGEVLQKEDSVQKYLKYGKEVWINDSYWLVMPFKLKDSGVTLKLSGLEENPEGVPSHGLELTFKSVGVTPENKYLVFVDKETKLVNYWSFFRTSDKKEPNFSTPWVNYERKGEILLSGDRGRGQLSNIKVLNEIPEALLREF